MIEPFRSAAVFAVIALAGMPAACARETRAESGEADAQTERVVPESRQELQLSYAPVVRRAAPAVVNVYSRRVVAQRSPFAGDPLFEQFFGRQPRSREVNSLGSGVIVDVTGLIVTNNHVVARAQELRVVLNDGREFDAELVLADERTDLAVLSIDAGESLPTLDYDLSGAAEVGDLILAIGNPFGVGQTVTSGIVSALARTDVGITDYAFFIQTDAAINPGNSGGALVNMDGELLGVNTAIFSRSGGSQGIGFAIPAEMVRQVVEAARAGEEIVRPWLGARLQPLTSDLARSLGLSRPRGALVADTYPDGPAQAGGLRQGDVIVAVDGAEVADEAAVRFRLATRSLGERADLRVLRDGEERTVTVRAEAPPGDPDGVTATLRGATPFQGSQVVELSPAFNDANGIDPLMSGVMIQALGRRSLAAAYGFQPGDRILEVGERTVQTIPELLDVLEDRENAREWPVEIERDGERFSRTLRL